MDKSQDRVAALEAQVQALEDRWTCFEHWLHHFQLERSVDLLTPQELLGQVKIAAHASDMLPPNPEGLAKLIRESNDPE